MCFIIVSIMCFVIFVSTSTIGKASDSDWYSNGETTYTSRIKVTLSNKLVIFRKDSPMIITRLEFPIPTISTRSITVVDPSLPSQREEKNGHYLPFQLDDIDKDGIWDELFFMTDFKASETKTMYIYIGPNVGGRGNHRTHAEIGAYGPYVVPWWESEHMGWKLWFPTDVDMYAKRKPKLVSNIHDTFGYGHNAPYDLGIDVMLVGKTFGAGGICLFEIPEQPDSLSRPRFSPYQGSGPFTETRYAFDVVVNGPLRSMIRVHTMNWRTGKGTYELEQYYTAYKNKNYFTCLVRYLSFLPEEYGAGFGCGIRKMTQENKFYQENGLVITSTNNMMSVITPLKDDPGLKEGVEEFLGLALIVKDSYHPRFIFTKSFDGNYVFKMPVTDDLTYEYIVAGAWSEGSILTNVNEFKEYILKTAQEFNSPIEIRLTIEKK